MPLKQVISGGQIGIDQCALEAAKLVGLQTGGCAPKGYKTLAGPAPWLLSEYRMEEHLKYDLYPPRTFFNVLESDGTFRLAYDFSSPGEKCTLAAILKYGKPYFDVDMNEFPFTSEVAKWIRKNKISILNVAGNANLSPRQREWAVRYLSKIFSLSQ